MIYLAFGMFLRLHLLEMENYLKNPYSVLGQCLISYFESWVLVIFLVLGGAVNWIWVDGNLSSYILYHLSVNHIST